MRQLTKRTTCAAAVLLGAFAMLAVTADYSDARGIRGGTAMSVHRGGGGFSRGGGRSFSRGGGGFSRGGGTAFAGAHRGGAVRGGEISRTGQLAGRGVRPGGDWASRAPSRTDFNRQDFNRQRIDNRTNINRRNDYRRDNYYRRNVHYNDIDVNVDHGWYPGWGWNDYHPVARGVAYGTAAAVTAAAIGSVMYSLPPSCTTYPHYGYTYYRCGNVWYQPQYSGDQVTYVVVEQPG